jgi:Rieske Fe-S protein
MPFSRKEFLHLGWKSFSALLLLPNVFLNSCAWEKKEDNDPKPEVEEDSDQPYIPPVGQNLSLDMGESFFYAGEDVEIKWQQTGLNKVTIYFSSDAGATWSALAMNIEASVGIYVWTVPQISSSLCLFRVTNAEDEQLKSESTTYFRIKRRTRLDLSLYSSLQTMNGFEIINLFNITTIIIRKTETEFLVLSMHCTHNGCIINYNGSTGFNCSCHGSQFNLGGEVLQGPAQHNLPEFENSYSVLDNELTITI